ncbi:DNRLRE domain-containing protein [Puniceicoccus vermicola]|uniref:PEP-CTERM sorting domain-containing protein n=1 Tax=Puniceicoccus vermicola TaxID=388746 RepID=A0A7X1B0P2_9BACT|nr:DNRLRE domain-containing protein [Puniceicoccus vermicola]MBC2603422.1 PEP-CTERM sorting domain-containing protein [Puniceicoccus vermicola]
MKHITAPSYFCLGLSLLLSPTYADTISSSQGSFVKSGDNADINYDSINQLQIAARGANNDRKIYLKFNLNGLLGSGEEFANTSFGLTTIAGNNSDVLLGGATGNIDFSVYGITDNDDDWSESTVTWNNAPKNDTGSRTGVISSGTVDLGSFTIDSSTVTGDQPFSISGEVLDTFLNDSYANDTDGIVTLIITSNGSTGDPGIRFWRSDDTELDTQYPRISYDVNPIPEPSTSGLLMGIVIVASSVLRRRR